MIGQNGSRLGRRYVWAADIGRCYCGISLWAVPGQFCSAAQWRTHAAHVTRYALSGGRLVDQDRGRDGRAGAQQGRQRGHDNAGDHPAAELLTLPL